MKLVRPYAKIVTPNLFTETGVDFHALRTVEAAARISHRSEDLQTDESWIRFLRVVVLERGDWSVAEHVSCSVELLVDRGITHELVRHRLFSYTQESTRFVNYEKKMPAAFVYPWPLSAWFDELNLNEADVRYVDKTPLRTAGWYVFNNQGQIVQPKAVPVDNQWAWSVANAESSYKHLLQLGHRPQEARSVLPTCLAAKILMTGNLRNWRHFFQMRTSKEAHPQMREVAISLLADFKRRYPILFEDVVPNEQQAKAIRKGR